MLLAFVCTLFLGSDNATKATGCSTRPLQSTGMIGCGLEHRPRYIGVPLTWFSGTAPKCWPTSRWTSLRFLQAVVDWTDSARSTRPAAGCAKGPTGPSARRGRACPGRNLPTRADSAPGGLARRTWPALDQINEAEGARSEASGGTAAQARPAGVPVGMQVATQGDRVCARCTILERAGGEPNRQRPPWQSPPGRSEPASVRGMASSPRRVLDPAAFSPRRSYRRERGAAREARRRLPAAGVPPQGWGPGAGGAAAARIRPARRRSE